MFYVMCINLSLQKVFSWFHSLTSDVPVRSGVIPCEICCAPTGSRTVLLLVIQFSVPVTFQYHCKTTLTESLADEGWEPSHKAVLHLVLLTTNCMSLCAMGVRDCRENCDAVRLRRRTPWRGALVRGPAIGTPSFQSICS